MLLSYKHIVELKLNEVLSI